MPQPNDLSRSLVALDQNSTIIAVVELSQVDLARFDADRENGPAARSFAADAHDCIMVRIKRSYRIQVCGTKMCHGELPSDPQHRQAPTRARSYAKARLAVHRRSACSGVKALRNTSDARRKAAKLYYRFGPLTPSARSANLIAGDGM